MELHRPHTFRERLVAGTVVTVAAATAGGLGAYALTGGAPAAKGPENSHVLTADTRLRELASTIIQREAAGEGWRQTSGPVISAYTMTPLKDGAFAILSEQSRSRTANGTPNAASVSSVEVEFFPASRRTTGVEDPSDTAIFDYRNGQWSAGWTEQDPKGHITGYTTANATGTTADVFNTMLRDAEALATAQAGQTAPALAPVPDTIPTAPTFGPPSRHPGQLV